MRRIQSLIAFALTLAVFTVFLYPRGQTEAVVSGELVSEVVVSGLNQPTTMAFAPDGRVFVAEKSGVVRIVKNGALLPTPFLTLPNVNSTGDRGLIGLALHPNFAQNGFVYLAYTHENNANNPEGKKTGRIVRVKANGDRADMSTFEVLVGTVAGDAARPSCQDFAPKDDCIPSDSMSHSVGGLRFGPDGKLYAALGDGAGFFHVDGAAYGAQDITSLTGKILRLNDDGTAPSDNPFFNSDPRANQSKVWAYGFRNPYRFNFRPGTGALYGAEVGWFSTEELNKIVKGANYAWPCKEGTDVQQDYHCTATGDVRDPFYSYRHDPDPNRVQAITGGAFVGDVYGEEYRGDYFFSEFGDSIIRRMKIRPDDSGYERVEELLAGADGPVEFVTGPDGYIYYLSIFTGEMRRIVPSGGPAEAVYTAVAEASTLIGYAPLQVDFSGEKSVYPDGQSVAFIWEFGHWNTKQGVTVSHSFDAPGTYPVSLSVSDTKTGQGDVADLTVTVLEPPPIGFFRMETFESADMSGIASVTTTKSVFFDDRTDLPGLAGARETFSVRYSGAYDFTEKYTALKIATKGETRVYIDRVLVYQGMPGDSDTIVHQAPPGRHWLLIEYVEDGGETGLSLDWQSFGDVSGAVFASKDVSIPTVQHHTGDLIPISVRVKNTGRSGTGLVDIEVYDEYGTQVAQRFFDDAFIAANSERTFVFDWQVAEPGRYRVAVGLFGSAWSTFHEWTDAAASVTVLPRQPSNSGIPFGLTLVEAGITSGTSSPGGTVTLGATLRNAGAAGEALVDLEIYDPAGKKVAQAVFDDTFFLGNQEKTFTIPYTIPASASGTYSFSVGVFASHWSALHAWHGGAYSFTMGQSTREEILGNSGLSPRWENWSWQTLVPVVGTIDGAPVWGVTYQDPWAGLYLHSTNGSAGHTTLSLRINGRAGGQRLRIFGFDTAGTGYAEVPLSKYMNDGPLPPYTWHTVRIPLADLGLAGKRVGGFAIMGMSGTTEGSYSIAQIVME